MPCTMYSEKTSDYTAVQFDKNVSSDGARDLHHWTGFPLRRDSFWNIKCHRSSSSETALKSSSSTYSAYPDYFSFLFPPSKSAWGLTSHQEGGGLELSKRAICWHFAIFLELSDFSTTPFHLHTLYKNMPCCHLQQNFTKKFCG